MRGGPLVASLWVDAPASAWERVPAGMAPRQAPLPKEAELRRFAGRPYYVFQFAAFESITVAADGHGQPRPGHVDLASDRHRRVAHHQVAISTKGEHRELWALDGHPGQRPGHHELHGDGPDQ